MSRQVRLALVAILPLLAACEAKSGEAPADPAATSSAALPPASG